MRVVVWLLPVVLLLSGGVARAQEVPYTVEVTGLAGTDLADRVEAASRLVTLTGEPPASLIALHRRADDDLDRVREALRAEGYYAGEVSVSMDDEQRPVPVVLAVTPGPAFTLAAFDVHLRTPPESPPPEPVTLDQMGIEPGARARAKPVLDAQGKLLRALAEQGYPLARQVDRRVVVDHAAQSMRVEVEVDTGPLARFGPVRVTGVERLDEAWVLNRIPWREGDRFDIDQMEKLRQRLVASGLFSSAKLSTAHEASPDGLLPITVEVHERDRRSIGAGASWSSSEGAGGQGFWEHRNLFGGAERLRLSLIGSEIRNAAQAEYRDPDFGRPDQDLVVTTIAEEQRPRAFVTRTVGIQAGFEWLLSPIWKASAAGSVERTFEEEDPQGTRNFTLVSIPLEARRDTSDDILDPTRGNRMVAGVRPFLEALGSDLDFVRMEVYDSQYLKLFDKPRVILAGWGRFGTIQGASRRDIPADKRFYVGGGGSVRAYGHQLAGPVDEAGDPIGGRSALAFGGEARVRVTDTIGVAPFIEAGSAYRTPLPDLGERLFWGAGLGVRYHTPIGPVRADVAIPFSPRSGIDDPFQVYLSLGQAF